VKCQFEQLIGVLLNANLTYIPVDNSAALTVQHFLYKANLNVTISNKDIHYWRCLI